MIYYSPHLLDTQPPQFKVHVHPLHHNLSKPPSMEEKKNKKERARDTLFRSLLVIAPH